MNRILTVIGNPNDINTWSNIPYFFLKAGQQASFLSSGLPLQPEKLRIQRLLWNAIQWARTGEIGGFQYSSSFLKALFSQVDLSSEPVEIISHYPLLPPAPWPTHWKVSYYIDATTHQIFQEYGLFAKIGRSTQEAALTQERENYLNADRIICMSPWAANSVINYYDIPSYKVHIIPGGANLNEHAIIEDHLNNYPDLIPLRLGFIGKDWHRKGLLYLLKVADVLHQRGLAVEVIVIGPNIQDLPNHALIRPLGFINKVQDLEKYIHVIRSLHFGCLFSSAEAFGISNLECLRLGVPVLANRVGGIPATVPDGLGFLFEPNTPPEQVANLLESFVSQPSQYDKLRKRVIERAKEFSWQSTIQKFIKLWQTPKEFS